MPPFLVLLPGLPSLVNISLSKTVDLRVFDHIFGHAVSVQGFSADNRGQ